MNKLRIDLSNLREEENKLEQRVENGKTQLEQLAKSHKDVLLQVNQVRDNLHDDCVLVQELLEILSNNRYLGHVGPLVECSTADPEYSSIFIPYIFFSLYYH